MDANMVKVVVFGLGGLVCLGMFVIVPLIAMLLSHQQKMAQLLNKSASTPDIQSLVRTIQQLNDSVTLLRLEVDELRQGQIPMQTLRETPPELQTSGRTTH